MHKGIMLIVKTDVKQDALNKVKEFLEEYKDDVWDWYQIGGRWQGELAPMFDEFIEKKKTILKTEEHGMISQRQVDDKQKELQELWESLGGEGDNPYSNHYDMPKDGGFYDVIPLSQCIKKVKEWQQKPEKDGLEELKKAKKYIKPKNQEDDWSMYGYCLECAANIFSQKFSFETNVFNIETDDFSIPEKIEDYFVVMVDIHN